MTVLVSYCLRCVVLMCALDVWCKSNEAHTRRYELVLLVIVLGIPASVVN